MANLPETDPRIYMAAQRTLLAWIRTGLALMGFGFVVARFGLFLRELAMTHQGSGEHSTHVSLYFGTALVVMGALVNLIAALEHRQMIERLRKGAWKPDHLSRSGIAVAITLALAGTTVAGYLLVVR